MLGIWNDRIYLDDACCFGRADRYQPATVSTISLKNGEESQPIDLYPDKAYHESQNLSRTFGQGGANYMIGKYLFVVVNREAVDPIVYRYDVTTLDKGFIRLRLSPLLDSAPLRSK